MKETWGGRNVSNFCNIKTSPRLSVLYSFEDRHKQRKQQRKHLRASHRAWDRGSVGVRLCACCAECARVLGSWLLLYTTGRVSTEQVSS